MKPAVGVLLQAVLAGDLNRAQKLLEQGASANEPDPETGGTVLHAALDCDHPDAMVKLLLDHTANVDATNKLGITPVMYAAKSCTEALRFMLKKNPDLRKKDLMDRDALTWAKNAFNPSAAALIEDGLKLQLEQAKFADFHQMALDNQAALRKRRVKTIFMAGPR